MEGRISHNCEECSRQVPRVLDRACTNVEQQSFYQQLQQCPRCSEKFEREKSFREFIHDKVPRLCCSRGLITDIRNSIRSRPD